MASAYYNTDENLHEVVISEPGLDVAPGEAVLIGTRLVGIAIGPSENGLTPICLAGVATAIAGGSIPIYETVGKNGAGTDLIATTTASEYVGTALEAAEAGQYFRILLRM